MKRARFSREQIIGILRENEAAAKAEELACKHGVSEETMYAWKAKFGGMSAQCGRDDLGAASGAGSDNANPAARPAWIIVSDDGTEFTLPRPSWPGPRTSALPGITSTPRLRSTE
jgi:putative transposase